METQVQLYLTHDLCDDDVCVYVSLFVEHLKMLFVQFPGNTASVTWINVNISQRFFIWQHAHTETHWHNTVSLVETYLTFCVSVVDMVLFLVTFLWVLGYKWLRFRRKLVCETMQRETQLLCISDDRLRFSRFRQTVRQHLDCRTLSLLLDFSMVNCLRCSPYELYFGHKHLNSYLGIAPDTWSTSDATSHIQCRQKVKL